MSIVVYQPVIAYRDLREVPKDFWNGPGVEPLRDDEFICRYCGRHRNKKYLEFTSVCIDWKIRCTCTQCYETMRNQDNMYAAGWVGRHGDVRYLEACWRQAKTYPRRMQLEFLKKNNVSEAYLEELSRELSK